MELTFQGYLGANFLLLAFCLSIALMPEYSSSLYSAIWVWLLSISMTCFLTMLLFCALYAGGVGGQFAALGVIVALFSWVIVIRVPLLYRVPPFREAIDSSYLGKIALVFIPYNTCCMLLRLRIMMPTFDSMKDGVQYLFEYLSWSILFALGGLALFALQIVTPPWNSQRAIARKQLTKNIQQIVEALEALDTMLDTFAKTIKTANVESFGALKTEMEDAAAVLTKAVAPLLQILGSQSALRARIVESGREPYWLCPEPRINTMPEMARLQMALLQANMHLVGAAKQVSLIVKAMDLFAARRARALLTNIAEVRQSFRIAILVCREGGAVLSLSRSMRPCTAYNEKVTLASQRLNRLRELMEGVRVRSSLGHGPLTRKPSKGTELVQNAHGLLHSTGVFQSDDQETWNSGERTTETADKETSQAGIEGIFGAEAHSRIPRQQNGGRRVSFKQSYQPGSFSQADHYQPSTAETMHPSAWGKAIMKSPLKVLQPKKTNRHREAPLVDNHDVFPNGDSKVDLSAQAIMHLPSLEVQSSVSPSMGCNEPTTQDSVFENASFFETEAQDIVDASRQHVEVIEGAGSLPLAAIRVRSSSTLLSGDEQGNSGERIRQRDCDEGSLRGGVVEPLAHFVDTAGDKLVTSDGGALVQPAGILQDALTDLPASGNFSVGEATAAEQPVGASSGEAPGKEPSADGITASSSMELGILLELLNQGSSLSGSEDANGTMLHRSPYSLRRLFRIGCHEKPLRKRVARDALTDVIHLPKASETPLRYPSLRPASSSTEKNWYTLETYEEPLKETQNARAVKQQVKLTMLVVSLIQIGSKDSLDFCSAIEAFIYSNMTPSWNRFWLNIRMVFLSGTVMGMQLSRGLWDLLYFWKWRFTGENAWYSDVDTVHCIKYIIGMTALYAVGVFADEEITMWLVGSVDLNSAVMPVSSWMILGFVSTMKWTFEGTVHTATSRVLGTCLGCACIYGAMMTTNSYEVMLAWNFALCFATFFIFANPADVYSSFHPEFGLIGQVFLWTCMFIFQTVWLRMDDSSDSPSALKLNVTNSRLWGNIVGIVTAVAVSHFPPYFSSETEVRFICQSLMGDCSRCVSLIGAAFVRSVCSSSSVSFEGRSGGSAAQKKLAQHFENAAVCPPEVGTSFTQECGLQGRVDIQNNYEPPFQQSVRGNHLPNSRTCTRRTVMECPRVESPCIGDANIQQYHRGREAKWRRGFCGIGFLALPETFMSTPVATGSAHRYKQLKSRRNASRERRKGHLSKKLQKPYGALKVSPFARHFRRRHRGSRQVASSYECLEMASAVLHHSFEPKLFLCRRLFMEGTKCPHSPLWWVDASMGKVLDLMDYVRMSIADSCQDFKDCLQAATVDPSPHLGVKATLNQCSLLMQTSNGRSLRQHFVRLIALQKGAYMDIGRELVSGRIGCWGRMPAYSACDCGRRQVSEIYLIAARDYQRRRALIESTLSAILSDVVQCSQELRRQTGYTAQERRMALSVLLLLLQKIEMRHAVTDDIHIFIAECIMKRAFPEGHLNELIQTKSSLIKRQSTKRHRHVSFMRKQQMLKQSKRRGSCPKTSGASSRTPSIHCSVPRDQL
ncbi:hypothetical protein, conserved [Eimeria necatrix]|uniref:Integral membrane bound transporter domain-containing protein n=1 Tax=Eimeria necatrix TaxID=51315 RepID=U6N173_9EIME|nr:hypothetical protein, conserved [Eimeria necatrix]CDJ69977.1 hypothetical protein, conserved [Eimeria necatrix]